MADKSVLVLGGGVGGVVTAVELRKKLPKQHKIMLVDREPEHVFAPSLLWLMVGMREPKQISRPLDRLQRKGIEVVHGEIERIEPEAKKVTVGGKSLSADYLVVSLGADLAPEAIPGLSEAGHNFYTLQGAQGLRA
ncbi:MAG: FAD-dependent oxidoreductase, partial [bacterium]